MQTKSFICFYLQEMSVVLLLWDKPKHILTGTPEACDPSFRADS